MDHEPAMTLLRRLYEEGAEPFTCDVVPIAAAARLIDATIVTRSRPDFEPQGASVLAYS